LRLPESGSVVVSPYNTPAALWLRGHPDDQYVCRSVGVSGRPESSGLDCLVLRLRKPIHFPVETAKVVDSPPPSLFCNVIPTADWFDISQTFVLFHPRDVQEYDPCHHFPPQSGISHFGRTPWRQWGSNRAVGAYCWSLVPVNSNKSVTEGGDFRST